MTDSLTCAICEGSMATVGDLLRCSACGVVTTPHRITTVQYDGDYIADRYDRYTTTGEMSRLRLAVVESARNLYADPATPRPVPPGRLLDVGYGNGDFIRTATAAGWDAYGCDVNPTPYPGVRRVDLPVSDDAPHYDVVTFFDSLEHFESLDTVRAVAAHADWIVLSFPRIPTGWPERGRDGWKHDRPGEHHWHFTPRAVRRLFTDATGSTPYRAEVVYTGSPEDGVRGALPGGEPNIATVALRIHHIGAVS